MLEVTEGAKRLREPLAAYLTRLRDGGLGILPGAAAEILDDEVRAVLCPDKITTDEWLYAHETAHAVGLRSNVTIMFGAVEQPVHWARHLVRTRTLPGRTGGFSEFVPLPFVHMAAPNYLQRRSRRGPTFRETVLMHAVGRIAYHGSIRNVQASWMKICGDGVRQLLQAGVNDLGGTLMDENISPAAGAAYGQGMERRRLRRARRTARTTAHPTHDVVPGGDRPHRDGLVDPRHGSPRRGRGATNGDHAGDAQRDKGILDLDQDRPLRQGNSIPRLCVSRRVAGVSEGGALADGILRAKRPPRRRLGWTMRAG